MDSDIDEYTALQKYISTYRDPKATAADSEGNQGKDAADAGKAKAWWQVSDGSGVFTARVFC